jgi:hypothetical protein
MSEKRCAALESEFRRDDFKRVFAVTQQPLSNLHALLIKISRWRAAIYRFEGRILTDFL